MPQKNIARGTAYIQLPSCSPPISLRMGVLNNRAIINKTIENPMAMIPDRKVNITASLSSVGRGMANSYLRLFTEVNIDTSDVNIASIPKSSGEYILARTTLARRGTSWEIDVPEI